jgi:hypothetical protein
LTCYVSVLTFLFATPPLLYDHTLALTIQSFPNTESG